MKKQDVQFILDSASNLLSFDKACGDEDLPATADDGETARSKILSLKVIDKVSWKQH